jgi:hypothetical protein
MFNDLIAYRLHRELASRIMDGTEAHPIIEELADALAKADGDIVCIRSAVLDAKARTRALIVGCVHVDAVINALGKIVEGD